MPPWGGDDAGRGAAGEVVDDGGDRRTGVQNAGIHRARPAGKSAIGPLTARLHALFTGASWRLVESRR
jgi:hypothetical protein